MYKQENNNVGYQATGYLYFRISDTIGFDYWIDNKIILVMYRKEIDCA